MTRTALHDFTRLNWDACTYQHNLKQSSGPGGYQLGTPMPSCHECLAADPRLRQTGSGVAVCADRPLVDVDSELRNITRPATNCPTGKYLPGVKGAAAKPPACALRGPKRCRDEAITSEDTRLSNPPCTMRGTPNGFNRWEWLCQDPQERVAVPFDTLVNNRLVVKDNHRPCLPTPIDPTLALPPHAGSDAPVRFRWDDCGKVVDNLPTVHWRSCKEIANY